MNERRRTLLFSGGYKIPTENGVYIESVDHEFYLTDDWDTANTANSIAVVADEHKFRIALSYPTNTQAIGITLRYEDVLTATTSMFVAETDYNGAYNTQQIITLQPSTDYAAGWCAAYIFPDGETNGYLPAYGELSLAYQNKDAIDAAILACGGTAFPSNPQNYNDNWHWSSTFEGLRYPNQRGNVIFNWATGQPQASALTYQYYVRPFAVLEDSN